jgi:trehalose 6-phosphate phosphatase
MTRIADLPAAIEHWEDVRAEIGDRRLVVFLDYDGTLSPIVDDPSAALLPERTRAALLRLRRRCPLVVMSGRDADDVKERMGLEQLVYAGSHGFDVIWPDGRREQRGTEYLDRLHAAQRTLLEAVDDIPGVEVEPKRFAIAVHYRRVDGERISDVERAVAEVASRFEGLRRTGGKKVFELRPDLEWDKGRALLWLLDELELAGDDVLPLYLGDDVTDEDAFLALAEHGRGLGLVVRGEADDRETAARYAMADVSEAGEVLERLSGLLEDRP